MVGSQVGASNVSRVGSQVGQEPSPQPAPRVGPTPAPTASTPKRKTTATKDVPRPPPPPQARCASLPRIASRAVQALAAMAATSQNMNLFPGCLGGPPSGSLASPNDRSGHPSTGPTARSGVKPCSSSNRLRQRNSGWGYLETGHRALWMQPSVQLKGGRRGRGLLPQDTQCLAHHNWDRSNLFKPCSCGNGLRSGHH